MTEPLPEDGAPKPTAKLARNALVPISIGVSVLAVVILGAAMIRRAASPANDVAIAPAPKPVGVVVARAASFHPTKRYVATIQPWLHADVGPQLVSAYVDTVIYRPGAAVKKGEVLATLDCRNASAQSQEVAMAAKALEAKEAAIAKEAARLDAMLDGGFVSQNEVDKKEAEAATEQAGILAQKAKLLGTSLEVDDCVLKAPFDGEIADRFVDPGAFAHPGLAILSVVDRSTVRIAADVPETDFALVTPGTSLAIRILATQRMFHAPIARRVPSADPVTRTVHFEIDIADPARSMPVGTTAELVIDVGDPIPAAEIPLAAATIRGDKATVFVVDAADSKAKKQIVDVLGESGGSLYLEPSLVGAKLVTDGRALLIDGDSVLASDDAPCTSTSATASVERPAKAP